MKTPVPQFASGVRYSGVRAVQCCAPPRRRSHFARILEILALSERANGATPARFALLDNPTPSHFHSLSQLTPYQPNFVEVLLDALPPCSHGGPIGPGALPGIDSRPSRVT